MAFVISGLEYKNTLVFLFQSLTLCKTSLGFYLGIALTNFSNVPVKMRICYIYIVALK